MDEETLHYLDPKDPLFHTKNTSIQSHNQIVALIKENKKNISDKVYYVFSLYFAIITTLYSSKSMGYSSFLIISNVCLLILIYPIWLFSIRRRELAKKKHKIEKNLNSLGIKLN